MAIDFEKEYGVNAGYAQALYDEWRAGAEGVDESWARIFERLDPEGAQARAAAAAPPEAPSAPTPEDEGLERLVGVAGRIARNMEESLGVPTATSVRAIPAKLLDENRRILNEHLAVRALGKASFTHLVAFAIVRALAEMPQVQASYEERDGKPYKRTPEEVNLGIAIDVPTSGGRTLVVPCVRGAEGMDFGAFLDAYEDVVRRGRAGELGAEDFRGTTATLTNPGGFGTSASVPRLMTGQGLILATGSISVPPELAGASRERLAQLAIGPVMTVTSTYDHRVIQGADSGLVLRRIDQFLQGEDGFYDDVFRSVRVPWSPLRRASDVRTGRGEEEIDVQAKVWMMINAYRVRGWQLADLDPLEYRPSAHGSLDPAEYGFTVWDLDRSFNCGGMCGRQSMTLREILTVMRRAYCRRWTVEYMHIVDQRPKHWMRERVEHDGEDPPFDDDRRRRVLAQIGRAENLERFLHAQYVGNKRFSLEGGDTLVPTLAAIIDRAAEGGVERVVIGMAHRGRLNVLANILGRSYEQLFGDFEGVLLPLSTEGSGDVKYHVGQRGTYTTPTGRAVEVFLSANPSHLEAVDPVVCGMARAYQDARGDRDRKAVLAVLVHGDAAFSGQGVVAETLQMSGLRAYSNGGTIHVVVNNQIGFTTSPSDARTTDSCTDIAKIVQAPVLHANGDYPESVVRASELAVDYQRTFGSDVVVDMVCYRRWGHNEGDEPAYTQPTLYARIRNHPTVREHYTRLLVRRGTLTRDEANQLTAENEQELRDALASFQRTEREPLPEAEVVDLDHDDPADYVDGPSPVTGIEGDALVTLIDRTNEVPEGHAVHPKLLRQLRRRERMVRGELPVDWGCAEVLAFGSLLGEGVPIRISGQDSGRGTFSHRHAVIRDQVTEADHVPLAGLAADGATFEIYDSLLSEEAVVGYEYGYSVARPEAFVIWEAQFGDFVNGAQIPIDQFLVAGEAKWRQSSGLTLLLPHGYDGQGPEHSSARPERFLQLCTGGNLTVANCSTAAQYFHLLRRQARATRRRPLVVLTPKSLLRDPRAGSPIEELSAERFHELLEDPVVAVSGARRVVLCSGKVYHELAARREELGADDVSLVRLEQLYPFPRTALVELLASAGDAELVWCQEEPRNMGAWWYVLQRFTDLGRPIRYVGRAESSSPASGSYRRHVAEQAHLVDCALERD